MNGLTIISHYFNEEFLLPHWLRWHRNFCSMGVMIDYGSNDNSNDIIREICPHWKIVQPHYPFFHAKILDEEVTREEKKIEGWKCCLNVTEFIFHHDFANYLDNIPKEILGVWLPVIAMIDTIEDEKKELNSAPLVLQRTNGQFGSGNVRNTSHGRLVHRAEHGFWVGYGRHASNLGYTITAQDACHLWFGWSPWNEQFIQRKLQIKSKINPEDRDMVQWTAGTHGMSRETMEHQFRLYQNDARDLMQYPVYKEIYDNINKKYGTKQ